MSTLYKPVTDHVPLEFEEFAKQIQVFLDQNGVELVRLALPDKDDFEDAELDDPGFKHFMRCVTQRLLIFAAQCSSGRVSSLNKVISTLEHIAKHPRQFIANPTPYLPEAVDAFSFSFLKASHMHEVAFLEFELGHASILPQDVQTVVPEAIEEYRRQHKRQKGESRSPKGAPRKVLMLEFARHALRCFNMAGGGAPTYTPNGRFQRFVELLGKPVFKRACAAGYVLNPSRVSKLSTAIWKAEQRQREIRKSFTVAQAPYF